MVNTPRSNLTTGDIMWPFGCSWSLNCTAVLYHSTPPSTISILHDYGITSSNNKVNCNTQILGLHLIVIEFLAISWLGRLLNFIAGPTTTTPNNNNRNSPRPTTAIITGTGRTLICTYAIIINWLNKDGESQVPFLFCGEKVVYYHETTSRVRLLLL